MNSLMTVGVAASIGALAITPSAPPPERPAAPDVRLAADSVPLGAIPAAFLRNQLTFCGLICPSIVQLVTTVPIGAAEAPLRFLAALPSGSLLKAVGAAAESVTSPADIATTGIITPDVFIVVPKAVGKTLQVTVVQAINVGESFLRPGQLPGAVQTAREKILEALNQPATDPPSNLPTGAQGVLEDVAVAGVSIPVAVAFQAGEFLLEGGVHTANVTATELADTGNPGVALAAGGAAAAASLKTASGFVTAAVNTAVKDIRGSVHQPSPLAVARKAPAAGKKPATQQPATQKLSHALRSLANGSTGAHRREPGAHRRSKA
ncbi:MULTISPECIES: hypothetical protein [unclassified Mycobacterium]|uniref:hypothetical protein n=1 Tax=unclassified Mycobacterium TaxID=2642494 RepID=UPI0029C7DE2A|nr:MULTISPECIES: hypothetical protein [unclassified Mycobacterium]